MITIRGFNPLAEETRVRTRVIKLTDGVKTSFNPLAEETRVRTTTRRRAIAFMTVSFQSPRRGNPRPDWYATPGSTGRNRTGFQSPRRGNPRPDM